jgi:hypothetical protein
MAKPVAPKQRDPDWYEKVNGRPGVQFVNYDFTPEQKATFKLWMNDNYDKAFDMMQNVVDGGYNLSVKVDEKSHGYAAFLTCQNDKSPNKGWILSGRGSHPLNAILGVMYRHEVLFDGNWPTDSAKKYALDDE